MHSYFYYMFFPRSDDATYVMRVKELKTPLCQTMLAIGFIYRCSVYDSVVIISDRINDV